jgi:cystathionine gamma-lyase
VAFAFASGLAGRRHPCLELVGLPAHIVPATTSTAAPRLFERVRKASAGHRFSFVDLTDPVRLEAALTPETKLVWVETPTNPLLRLADLRAIAEVCRARGILCAADNTFASPWVQRPLEVGFDIVVHSATKYLNGHSDVIGGVAIVGGGDRLAPLRERLGFLQNAVGAIAGPFDSFLVLRGVKTWPCGGRHCASAPELARWLSSRW